MSGAIRGVSSRLIALLVLGALAAFALDVAPKFGFSWPLPYSVFAVLLLAAASACRSARKAAVQRSSAAEVPVQQEHAAPLPIAMAAIDREHRCVSASPALAAWFGA